MERHQAFAGAPQRRHAGRLEVAVELGELGLVRGAVEALRRLVLQACHLGCLLQSRASRAAMSMRNAFLSILPTLVTGNSGTITSRSGHLKRATPAAAMAERTS